MKLYTADKDEADFLAAELAAQANKSPIKDWIPCVEPYLNEYTVEAITSDNTLSLHFDGVEYKVLNDRRTYKGKTAVDAIKQMIRLQEKGQ